MATFRNSNTFVKGIPRAKPVFPPHLLLQVLLIQDDNILYLESTVKEECLGFNHKQANVTEKHLPVLAATGIGKLFTKSQTEKR